MAKILPVGSDPLNSPSHSLLHRVVSVDSDSPESSVDVDASGNVVVLATINGGTVLCDNSLFNTIFGFEAGVGAVPNSSNSNTYIGYQSGKNSSGGIWGNNGNTALGYQSLNNAIDVYDHIAIGTGSMMFAQNGGDNIGIGREVMIYDNSGTSNIGIGTYALHDSSGAVHSIAIGNNSQHQNVSSGRNISIGSFTLWQNTSGTGNTAIGTYSLQNNSSGSNNIALGYYSGSYSNDSDSLIIDNQDRGYDDPESYLIYGKFNVDKTLQTLRVNASFSTGQSSGGVQATGTINGMSFVSDYLLNTVVGTGAGPLYGGTGERNTSLGYHAGNSLYLYSQDSVAIGYNAMSSLSYGGVNNIAIGSSAMETATSPSMIGIYDCIAIGKSTLLNSIDSGSNIAIGNYAMTGDTTSYNNIAIGDYALGYTNPDTSSNYNLAIGFRSMGGYPSGAYNTAIGHKALNANTGSGNVALGYFAGGYSTDSNSLYIDNQDRGYDYPYYPIVYGQFNLYTGNQLFRVNASLEVCDDTGIDEFTPNQYSITGGVGKINGLHIWGKDRSVTFVGYLAGANAGYDSINNTYIGYQAGYSNNRYGTGGSENTAVGYQALYSNVDGSSNDAFGSGALHSNTVGIWNVAIGSSSLYSNTEGTYNVAVGRQSLMSAVDASFNTALGFSTLYSNTSGNTNTAIGCAALNYNTTGSYNVALGNDALYRNDTGSFNTAIGTYAFNGDNYASTFHRGTAIGYSSFYNLISGDFNTGLGYMSGYYNSTGSRNVMIGPFSGAYELGSDTFYVDNQDRINTAGDKTSALLYGKFDATPANQTLHANATLTATNLSGTNTGDNATNSTSLQLDQTTPQTITGGVPLLDADLVDFTDNHQIINKEYADNLETGGVKSFYFTVNASDVVGMYYSPTTLPTDGLQTITTAGGDGENVIATFITPVMTSDYRVTEGTRFFHVTASVDSTAKPIQLRGRIYTCALDGSSPVLLRTSNLSQVLTLIDAEYSMSAYGTSLLIDHTTTRVIFEISSIKTGTGANPNVLLRVNDDTFSRLDVPSPVGVTDISHLVPYTGATSDVNLGVHSITASNLSGTNTGDDATNSQYSGLSGTIATGLASKQYYHGVVARPVGATNPLPTFVTVPKFTLGATTNNISYYYQGTLVDVTADKSVILNDGTGATTTSGVLVVGNHYKITTYVAGDDFSNSTGLEGTVNTTGYTFTCTNATPTVWSNGSSVQRIGMPKTYFIYFDGTTGNILQGGFPGISNISNVIIATVNWNGTDYGLVGDERHGSTRNCDWHQWAHDTIGVRYENGITLTASGSTTTATLSTTVGTIHDEDIEFNVPASSTFSTVNSCRHFWQTGASTYVFDKTLSIRPYKFGTSSRPVYVDSSNSYALTTINGANNRFLNFFFYATTDLDCPIYMFVGTSTAALVANGYTSLANARAVPFPNLSAMGIGPELKPIYRVIVNGDGLVQTITSADDYRTVSSLPQSAGTVSTSASAVSFVPTGDIGAGNVQDALVELDTEKMVLVAPSTSGNVLTSNGSDWTSSPPTGIPWSEITSNGTMIVNTGSLANKGSLLELALPTTCAVGKTVRVAGMNAGLWRITQAANQYIKFDAQSTTPGVGGYIGSSATYDSVELICIVADLGFVVVSSVGTLTVV